MQPEIENNINEALGWLQKTGGQIQDLATEQAPLYCREVVAWEFWSSTFWASLAVVMLIAAAILLNWGRRVFIKDPWCDDSFVPIVGGMTLAVVSLIMIGVNAPNAIKATVAPRMVIVEHLRGLNK